MNELHERLDALGRAGSERVHVTRPDVGHRRSGRKVWLPVGALAAVIAIVVGIVVWQAGGGDGGDEVVTTDRSTTPDAATDTSAASPTTAASRTPMVAFAEGTGGEVGEPSTLRIRFIAPDGSVIADRAWSEVQEPQPGMPGRVFASRGLLQRVPVGRTRIEIRSTDSGWTCITTVTATPDSRLIVGSKEGDLVGDAGACAAVTSVDEMLAMSSPVPAAARPYLGMTAAEAEAYAEAQGTDIRIVSDNGLSRVVTMDLRDDRVNLTLYDDRVVVASMG